jgi:hypothetical protein
MALQYLGGQRVYIVFSTLSDLKNFNGGDRFDPEKIRGLSMTLVQ